MKLLGIIFFVTFISVFFAMVFIVFRNIFYYFLRRHNLYATLASLAFIFLVLGSFLLSSLLADALSLYIKRVFDNLLGVFFIYFITFLLLEAFRFFGATDRKLFFVFLLIGSLIVLFSVYNAYNIDIVEVDIHSDKIDRGYKIAAISDLHLGSNTPQILEDVVAKLENKGIDFLLIGGDFIDENHIIRDNLSAINRLKIQKYYAYGNHEIYIKKNIAQDISKKYNLTLLRNQSRVFEELQIIGVDDNQDNLEHYLKDINIDSTRFSILLNHQPLQYDVSISEGIDLVYSGHTHNGQIFPFNFLVKLRYKHITGLKNHEDTTFYVTPGTGTWGPKMRIGSKNEITIFNLRPKNHPQNTTP